ncbi:hypothetical protein B0A69_20335 [Chryseobacterium shigense]|uniref:Microcystin-dependent protein n=1 Tax=Chryseobacterium shigense TaxID=297244 RepID=A0A1N7I0Y1_9FLAO|nr:hypothetical protein [Chryseobacterium shigense]PQA90678.1 hypothetical protein B0A69_20335 [Chryseobacterium shigense]SIS30717.1 hypothetical protein SAMN05421639_1011001 [Chryseobacterium shigense]
MKTTLTVVLASVLSNAALAQIGINTPMPIASLDIVAKRTDGSTAEGVLPPRLSGEEIKAGDSQYTENHAGTIVYASAAVRVPSSKTANITAAGLYYYDGKMWQRMLPGDPRKLNPQSAGDIKNSMQPSDHNGWYLLNGRSVSSLPSSAQTSAAGLGFTTSLPDAADRVLKTRNGAELLGSQGGNNNMTITRSNLPDINLIGVVSGTAESAGAHTHTSDEGGFLLGGTNVGNNGSGHYQGNSDSSSWGGVGMMGNTATSGAHIHSLSGIATIPTGGLGATMDNRSAYMVVNTFIYLGE